MGLLNRATRAKLLSALREMPLVEAYDGRTQLLQNLPPDLVDVIERSNTKITDLGNIIQACNIYGDAAVRMLIETAHDLVPGSASAGQLQAVLDGLALLTGDAKSAAPAAKGAARQGGSKEFGVSDARIRLVLVIQTFIPATFAALALIYVASWIAGDNIKNVLADPLASTRSSTFWITRALLVFLPALAAAFGSGRHFSWPDLPFLIGGALFGQLASNWLMHTPSTPADDFTFALGTSLFIWNSHYPCACPRLWLAPY